MPQLHIVRGWSWTTDFWVETMFKSLILTNEIKGQLPIYSGLRLHNYTACLFRIVDLSFVICNVSLAWFSLWQYNFWPIPRYTFVCYSFPPLSPNVCMCCVFVLDVLYICANSLLYMTLCSRPHSFLPITLFPSLSLYSEFRIQLKQFK